MARPMGKLHQDDVRAKIQTSQLINRLMGYINGEVELSTGQVNAIKILLGKSLADLSAITLDGNIEHELTHYGWSPVQQRPSQ